MRNMADWIIDYYNQENKFIPWNIIDWVDGKYTASITAPRPANTLDFMVHMFWAAVMMLSVIVFIFLPQIISHSVYWFALLRYRRRMDYDDMDENTELRAEAQAWCKENKIKTFWFFEWHNEDIVFWLSSGVDNTVGFVNKKDAMAFKLRWL